MAPQVGSQQLAQVLGGHGVDRLATLLEDVDRMGLLVGEPFERGADTGATVCSCFGVGRRTIENAVRSGCHTPKALGAKLKCGTNCGSCVPELKTIIAQTLAPA